MKILGKGMDPGFWAEVREKKCFAHYREELKSIWDATCIEDIEELTYSKFKLFWTTGDRNAYQAIFFRRRRAISAASILALIYPDEPKYLDRLSDELFAICNEYTWCLPAHHGKLEYNYSKMIDLFAAETAFYLSEIYVLLRDRLDPLIRNRIVAEVDRRVIRPYAEREREYWWEESTNNWSAVCMASIAGAVMHLRPELFCELEPRFAHTMECYLKGFKPDGMCLEGVGYWHYGFGFFVMYADMARTFTEGRINYFSRPLVKTISTFIQKMFLNGKACVSFADSGAKLAYQLGLVHRLKSEYPNDILCYDHSLSYNYDNCGRYGLHLRSALWMVEEYYNNPDDCVADTASYAEDSQWFIKRTPNYGFAAKAGCNGEHHNHNDVGTFIFAKDGRQLLMDTGSGMYSRQYFSKERYTFIQTSSAGHNVPMINGKLQMCGGNYAAKDAKFENGVFSSDIAGVYGIKELHSLKRSFTFDENNVYMTDAIDYEGEGTITERFMCPEMPTVEKGIVKIATCTLTYDPAITPPTVTVLDAMKNNGDVYYALDFTLPAGTKEFKICIN